ncbi:MAG: hypothetical protein WD118_06845 [Phycisphaeraceae bacterium]
MWLKLAGLLPALGRLLPGKVLVVAVVLAAGVGAWLWHDATTSRLETALAEANSARQALSESRDQWQARAESQARSLAREREERRHAEAAVRTLQADLQTLDNRYTTMARRIRQAPAEDDGPVAPVLRETLEALP